ESARLYHRLATVATSREALRWRARALVEQQTEDWTLCEQIWATSLLLEAGDRMMGAVPPEETIAVARAAHKLAFQTDQRTDQIDALNLLARATRGVADPAWANHMRSRR